MEDTEIKKMAEFEDKYWWFLGRQRMIITQLEKQLKIKNNLKILDVGCGTGGTSITLRKFGTVYGVDFSLSALKYANQRGLDKVLKGSVYDLPFPQETFDLIVILDSLEHIEDDVGTLSELKRVLKKDGVILIAVPAFQFLWSEHDVALSHFRRYNSKRLSKVIREAGLQKIWSSYGISLLFPFVVIYRMATRLKKNKINPKQNLVDLPNFVNSILKHVLFFESEILQRFTLPFGLSLLCFAKIEPIESLGFSVKAQQAKE